MKNKNLKELISKYGKDDMIEEIDEHYVGQSVRDKLRGYKKADDKLHVYKDKYLLKGYNVKYIKHQPKEEQERIEREMDKHKIAIAEMRNGRVKGKVAEFDMSDTIDIPLVNNKAKELDDDMDR